MKKILTAMLCALLICLLVTPVSAAEAKVVISSSESALHRGDTFTVIAVLNNSEPIGLCTVVLSYRTDIFEMIGGFCTFEGGVVRPSQSVGTYLVNPKAAISGKIFIFEMRVKEDAAFGTYGIDSQSVVKENEPLAPSSIRITVACRHDYQNCTKVDDGNHQSTCKTCGDVLKQSHNWVDTEVLKEASCKETGSKKQKCTDCGAERTADIPLTDGHTFGAWSKAGDNSHTRICSICQREESQAHTWNAGKVTKKATCKQTGTRVRTCTGCGAEKTETIAKTGHTYPTYTEVNGNVHTAVCGDCGNELTEPHDYGKDWTGDSANHYKLCNDCGYISGKQAHTPDAAGEVCTVCGRNLLSDHTHEFSQAWSGDEAGHWHSCTECDEHSEFAVHVYDDGCDEDCNICEAVREPLHRPAEQLESDKTGHWYPCSLCGAKTGYEDHIPGDKATNSKPQTCTECGFVINPVLAHEHYPDTEHTHMCECGESYVADAESCAVCREAHKQFPWWIICILEALIIAAGVAYWFLRIRQNPRCTDNEEELW